ncbi:similar to Na+/H+ exchanger family protein [Plenodomus lingam JN3]|uniref:Similar to Na+/H+ exchanger family protein n=2 Tax=Leptosphaeria maculans TaxID=5022 RepID=E5ABA0_LEPMJ|nr:similar to Na+/H+ exchanger family protein [Plenodomus lingam JN3]CBY00941.1 similar to Na+/H+ exchanger family protein [Plenodomus lingam JN3]
MVQFGYLGLLVLVYQGGLHTSFQSLKANLLLSSAVALTGIAVPIGLSYTLQELLDATPLQAFAAGAALCSTSLGTTFTVLGSSGLSTSRLGVVLASAAMMDDVVGLVMVQVISNLGGDDFSWVTAVRPVLVSVAFATAVPLVCLCIARPITFWLNKYREEHPSTTLSLLLLKPQTVFFHHTLLLIGLVTAATYAGTSGLFAAYLAGASISWWDSELPHPPSPVRKLSPTAADVKKTGPGAEAIREPTGSQSKTDVPMESAVTAAASEANHNSSHTTETAQHDHVPNAQLHEQDTTGSAIYQRYYHPSVSKILQPLFFASIGFSIPITRMFNGPIVWRGIVYAVLMAFAKLACGLWLVRFSVMPGKGTLSRSLAKVKFPSIPHLWGRSARGAPSNPQSATNPTLTSGASLEARSSPSPPKPVSLHPPLILALAMCARGEIGFLISGVAESNGIFSASGVASADEPSDIFLVVTWSIVLCTILGPLGVGMSVRRVKKLQERKNRQQEGSGRDVLGVWGVD